MSSRRPLSKAEKSLFLTCGLIIVPLVAVVIFCKIRDAEPNWNIPAAAPRPVPNGYDFYVAAAKATVRFKPEVDPVWDKIVNPPNSPYALKNYSLTRRQKWLKANTKTFALFNQGLKTPSMAPDYEINPRHNWAILRRLSRDVSVRTRTFQIQNQPMRATTSALDGMQMGQDCTRGGGLMARRVGISIMRISGDPLEDWNKTINSLTADEARSAARRLETLLAHEPTTVQTLTIEKRDYVIEMKQYFTQKDWRGPWSRRQPARFEDGENFSQVWQRQITSKNTLYINSNQLLDTAIANAKRPYSHLKTATWPANLDVFNSNFVGALDNYLRNEARLTTINNMLLLRLALRAYIAEHGAAPPTLGALAPGYLKTVPSDVYNDGKPLFYTSNGKTYKLWSVGPDGINNGGVPLSRKSKDEAGRPTVNRLNNTGDFVASLCR